MSQVRNIVSSDGFKSFESGLGTFSNALSDSRQLRFKSEVAKNNALVASFNADQAREEGQINIDAVRLAASAERETGKVGFAASNILVGSGSALDFELDSATREAVGVAIERYNTSTRVTAFQNEQAQQDFLKKVNRGRSRSLLLTGSLKAASEIIPTVGDLF